MAVYADLTPYTYFGSEYARVNTVNVGWLGPQHTFETAVPDDHVLEVVWRYCAVSVAGLRGLHRCELCPETRGYLFMRGDARLLLGAAEIRVFGDGDTIFAAPNLIYHYIVDHHYRPPPPFLKALRASPAPPDSRYFDVLKQHSLSWTETSAPAEEPVTLRSKP